MEEIEGSLNEIFKNMAPSYHFLPHRMNYGILLKKDAVICVFSSPTSFCFCLHCDDGDEIADVEMYFDDPVYHLPHLSYFLRSLHMKVK